MIGRDGEMMGVGHGGEKEREIRERERTKKGLQEVVIGRINFNAFTFQCQSL